MAKPVPPSLSDVVRKLSRQDNPFVDLGGEALLQLGQLLSGARVRCTFDDKERPGHIKSFEALFVRMVLTPEQLWGAVFAAGPRRRVVQVDLIYRFEVIELQVEHLLRTEPDLVARHTARRR